MLNLITVLISQLWSFSLGIGVNLATDKVKELLNQPTALWLWKRFYEAFYDAFQIIELNQESKYSPKQIENIKFLKEQISLYVGDTNYYPLIKIFQDHSSNNFDRFLSSLKNDLDSSYKEKIAKSIFKSLKLRLRTGFKKNEAIEALKIVLANYYDAFLSKMSTKEGAQEILKSVHNLEEQISKLARTLTEIREDPIQLKKEELDAFLVEREQIKDELVR